MYWKRMGGGEGNKRKKQKRKFVITENKIKDIMPTSTHRTELMLQEKNISYIHEFKKY